MPFNRQSSNLVPFRTLDFYQPFSNSSCLLFLLTTVEVDYNDLIYLVLKNYCFYQPSHYLLIWDVSPYFIMYLLYFLVIKVIFHT